jgi:hypothetical protein
MAIIPPPINSIVAGSGLWIDANSVPPPPGPPIIEEPPVEELPKRLPKEAVPPPPPPLHPLTNGKTKITSKKFNVRKKTVLNILSSLRIVINGGYENKQWPSCPRPREAWLWVQGFQW